ncbi:MAG: ATP-dependent 6-phosphofructokinase [Candidatus Omnitrophica bacterium]|nr:ATP-dependent 6-phosphofructokinase [Candidatus Omnitrophota bacterium]
MGKKVMKIAILTGGGDCPGLNAVIRAVTKTLILENNAEITGILDGYDGLVLEEYRKLGYSDVSGILAMGGTILGTSNVANPYKYPVKDCDKIVFKDLSKTVIRNLKKLGAECLVCVGGDGTLNIANSLFRDGVPVVGIPKTIDNDIYGTDVSFGFDTAMSIAAEGIDRLETTGQSHHRIMILEVMGRRSGWLALYAGVAGGADIVLLPEIPYDMDVVAKVVKARNGMGKRFSMVVVSEGAKPKGGDVVGRKVLNDGSDPIRLGGIGFVLADDISRMTGLETRTVVLGHLMRGGSPTPFDRVLGTRLGVKAAGLIQKKKYGYMVGVNGSDLVDVPLTVVAKGSRLVPPDHELIKQAKSVGTSFGV